MPQRKMTWKGRIEQRIESLLPYRRVLSDSDETCFDQMMQAARQRRSSSAMLLCEEPLNVMLLSMLLESYQRIESLERRLAELRLILCRESLD